MKILCWPTVVTVWPLRKILLGDMNDMTASFTVAASSMENSSGWIQEFKYGPSTFIWKKQPSIKGVEFQHSYFINLPVKGDFSMVLIFVHWLEPSLRCQFSYLISSRWLVNIYLDPHNNKSPFDSCLPSYIFKFFGKEGKTLLEQDTELFEIDITSTSCRESIPPITAISASFENKKLSVK